MEGRDDGLNLLITEGGKEGMSKVHCVMQVFGRALSRMPQKRRSRSCRKRGDTRSGKQEQKQLGSKREGEKEEVRCELFRLLGGIASVRMVT